MGYKLGDAIADKDRYRDTLKDTLKVLESFPMLLAPATSAWGKEVQDWQKHALAQIQSIKRAL